VLDRPLLLLCYTDGLIGGRHGPGTTERFEMYRFDPIRPGLTLRHARPPIDLHARPQFDGSGMCSDTAMPPCRQDSRDTRPAKMLLRSIAPAQQKEVRKASSLTGMRSNLESQYEQAAFRLVRWVWWAWEDLNLGPHPYQKMQGTAVLTAVLAGCVGL
jgi:hypothetical protein